MKINIGVTGRFHAFNLAEQLNRRGLLNKLITTYPKFKVKEWKINDKQIITEIFLGLLNRYRVKIPLAENESINKLVKKLHAKKCAKYLNECDIHIGWSGGSLETIIEAKKIGKVVILERGSSHYSYQMRILKEEGMVKGNDNFTQSYQMWQRELLEYELADYISIPSSFVKRTFVKAGIAESKLLINPYGVDLKEFRQVKKKDKVFRIVFSGGGTLRKGYHYLLQAFFELNLPNCELWHLGVVDAEVRPFLKKYANNNWILKGHKKQSELYKYYSQGSVFIMPSLEEGLSMVQIQAMACGLPLICTTNSGGEDLITENGREGFVIPIRNVDAIKNKILFMYENQVIAKQMGDKAKERVEGSFSWNNYGDRYILNLEMIDKNIKLSKSQV